MKSVQIILLHVTIPKAPISIYDFKYRISSFKSLTTCNHRLKFETYCQETVLRQKAYSAGRQPRNLSNSPFIIQSVVFSKKKQLWRRSLHL